MDLNPGTESKLSLRDLHFLILAHSVLTTCAVAACQLCESMLVAFSCRFVVYFKKIEWMIKIKKTYISSSKEEKEKMDIY